MQWVPDSFHRQRDRLHAALEVVLEAIGQIYSEEKSTGFTEYRKPHSPSFLGFPAVSGPLYETSYPRLCMIHFWAFLPYPVTDRRTHTHGWWCIVYSM